MFMILLRYDLHTTSLLRQMQNIGDLLKLTCIIHYTERKHKLFVRYCYTKHMMFKIAQYLIDHPKVMSYEGYTRLAINKVDGKIKVTLENREGGVFVVTLE